MFKATLLTLQCEIVSSSESTLVVIKCEFLLPDTMTMRLSSMYDVSYLSVSRPEVSTSPAMDASVKLHFLPRLSSPFARFPPAVTRISYSRLRFQSSPEGIRNSAIRFRGSASRHHYPPSIEENATIRR